MKGKNFGLRITCTVAGALALAGTVACSSGDSSSGTSSTATTGTVSGTLTQATVSSINANAVEKFETAFATTGTKITLDCGPSGSVTATVDPAAGTFSAPGVPLGVPCSFSFTNATTGATKCQVQFQDTSNYDLNNNAASTGTASATSNISLGAITCDSSGTVTVPAASVANVGSGSNLSSALAFDSTGTWTIGAYTGTLPTGYQTVVASCSNGGGCGPTAGQVISLIRFHGTKFTPSSGQCNPAINVTCPASAGTVDATKEGYAMSIWGGDYAHGIGACGGNTGFTADEARAFAHLNLDATAPTLAGNQLNYAHYAWATPTGFGTDSGWSQPWMWGGATTPFDLYDCQPVSVPSTSGAAAKPGMACFSQIMNNGSGTGTYVWTAGLQNSGGCVDSSNNPIMVSNWSNLIGSCTNTASAFNSNFQTSTCTYTGSPVSGQASTTFTCSNTFGAFNDISGGTGSGANNGPNFSSAYTFTSGQYPGQPAKLATAGSTTCASLGGGSSEATLITAATGAPSTAQALAAKKLLNAYQCYGGAYWQHASNGSGSTTCARNYNFNWSTNNYANFVSGDDRSMKPQNAFMTDRVFYSADGNWAFVKNTDTQYQSIPTASGSTLCPFKQTTELKIQKVTAAKMLVNFTTNTVMADRSATCQGAVNAAIAGAGKLSPDPQGLNNLYQQLQTQKMIFTLTK